MNEPLYHRWVFSPRTGDVTLSHNKEGHPAFVRTHGDLAEEVSDPDAVHGYVFRVKGGYRVLDYAHNPVEDGYIKRQVTLKLAQEKNESSHGWNSAGSHGPEQSRPVVRADQ